MRPTASLTRLKREWRIELNDTIGGPNAPLGFKQRRAQKFLQFQMEHFLEPRHQIPTQAFTEDRTNTWR